MKVICYHLISLGKETIREIDENELCPDCYGTGNEICDNPDHGGIESGLFGRDQHRIGCPLCGHDEQHRMKSNCPTCDGTGRVSHGGKYEKAQS